MNFVKVSLFKYSRNFRRNISPFTYTAMSYSTGSNNSKNANDISLKSSLEHNHQHQQHIEHNHEHTHEHNHEHTQEHSHDHGDGEGHEHSHSGIGMFSHSHSHTQPNELLTSSFSNPAVRITWIGLIVNIGMAVSKGVGGVYFHSQSLIADAIHSASDMIADFLTLATVNVASKIGTPDMYPMGYGKIESVGSLLVSGILLFAGISVGWSSLLQVFEFVLPSDIYDTVSKIQIGHSHTHGPIAVDHGSETSPTHGNSNGHAHEHSHSNSNDSVLKSELQIPDINAAWLAAASIVVKEILYQQTMKVANQTNSKVLVANAWHHRVDSLTAFVAVCTVTGGVLFNVAWLDSVGGILVSLLIIKAGWGSFKSAIYELIDKGEPKTSEISSKYLTTIKENINDNNFKVCKISVLTSGANSNIFITLATTEKCDLEYLNNLEDNIINDIKSDDKFIRNIYIQFKRMGESQYNELNDDNINIESK